jgi:serine/threonine-protein kinase HipA
LTSKALASIAGAQEKTALTRWKGQWCRPHGATPTTHIVMLPLGPIGGSKRVDASDSVQNE